MDPKIPANLKRYIRKVRDGKKEKKITQKQQQTSKQNQIVIINPEPSKRKSKPRKRKTIQGSGKDDYPRIVYLPTSSPNLSVSMNQPQIMNQPIPQQIPQFQEVPIYRNPLRDQSVRNQFNQPPQFASNQVEQNLPYVDPYRPNPVMPNIVQQPNYIDFLSVSSNQPSRNIFSGLSSLTYDSGEVEFQEVNQLNEQRRREEMAYDSFGGYDAQSISSLGSILSQPPFPSSFIPVSSPSSSFDNVQQVPYNPPSVFSQVQEQNIFTPPTSPNPILPDIVEEQNSIISLSQPMSITPITSTSSLSGFVENAEVNQLNEKVNMEQKAYEDFGGINALLEASKILEERDLRLQQINEEERRMKEIKNMDEEEKQMRLAKQLNMGQYYESLKKGSPKSQEPQIEEVGVGGGGGELGKRRGRPLKLTEDDLKKIEIYSEIRYSIPAKKRTELEQQLFREGQEIFESRSRTYPEVIVLKDSIKKRIEQEKEVKIKKKKD